MGLIGRMGQIKDYTTDSLFFDNSMTRETSQSSDSIRRLALEQTCLFKILVGVILVT